MRVKPLFSSSDLQPASTRNLININAGPDGFIGDIQGTPNQINFYNENIIPASERVSMDVNSGVDKIEASGNQIGNNL